MDEFSSVPAPYAASDPATAQYFDGLIRRARAPILCADAGPVKGKAIYAAHELKRAARIWTETPFVAMQHEENKRAGMACCQCCFLPLLYDYSGKWRDVVTRWNAHVQQTNGSTADKSASSGGSSSPAGHSDAGNNDKNADATTATSGSDGTASPALTAIDVNALDEALRRLEVSPRGCGLAGPAVQCVCGEVYCSRECQARAFHESHALLCPRGDPCSAMGEFLQHMQHTNDIFLLVAKVIARLLSRYLVLRDVVKARAPIDMFYKKPWWEVVLEDPDGEHEGEEDNGYDEDSGDDDSNGDHGDEGHRGDSTDGDVRMTPSARRTTKRIRTHGPTASEGQATRSGVTPASGQHRRGQADHQHQESSDGLPDSSPNDVTMETPSASSRKMTEKPSDVDMDGSAKGKKTAPLTSQSPQYLQEVLALTHQLLLDALECNLVRLERENQLCGVAVDEVWRACSSVLSFEFFAALIGMFEMNNISLEIDHPFHALIDFFDPDMPAEVPHPTLSHEDQVLVAHVRRVLQWEEAGRLAQRRGVRDGGTDDDASGFLGVEGTALFPIMCTMNHSCDPNCTVLYTRNGEGHVVAIRDIQQGEELCICYIDIDMDLAARERNLREYKFTCHCSRCAREREQLDKTKQQQHQDHHQQHHDHGRRDPNGGDKR